MHTRLLRTWHLFFLLIPHLYAGTAAYPAVSLNKEYFLGYINDGVYLAASPVRWRLKEWGIAALVTGGTISLYLVDEDIFPFVQNHRNSTTETMAKIVKPVGDGLATHFVNCP